MKIIRILLAVALLGMLTSTSGPQTGRAAAGSGTGYALGWSSLDGGGSVTQAGTGYALSGAIAQPDAQTWSNAHYRLKGGFWQDWLHWLFLPLIERE